MADHDKDLGTDVNAENFDQDVVDPEVQDIFRETQDLNYGGGKLSERLNEYTAESPELSGGDLDADWTRNNSVGEEGIGGSAPTPDQAVVDEIGEAVGITYQDTEPLHTADKLEARDRQRWELDPASSEEYSRRIKEEFKEPIEPPQDKE